MEWSKQWLQKTDLNSEPDSIHNPNKMTSASVLSVHLWNGDTNTLLVGLCEEQIRCGCKMLGAAGCLFSRRGRVQTKRSKCPPNHLSLRLSSPWYDKHLILVKESFWSGFLSCRGLKMPGWPRFSFYSGWLRWPWNAQSFCTAPCTPGPTTVLSLPLATEGMLFQGLPTAKMNGMAPNSASGSSVWGLSWKTYMPSHGVMCHSFDASLGCILSWLFKMIFLRNINVRRVNWVKGISY